MLGQSFLTPPTDHREHPSRARWDLFCIGDLPQEEHQSLEQHLEQCPHCQAIVEAIREEQQSFARQANREVFLAQMLTRQQQSPPPTLWQRFLDAIPAPVMWSAGPVAALGLALLLILPRGSSIVPGQQVPTIQKTPQTKTNVPKAAPYVIGVKGSQKPVLDVYRIKGSTKAIAQNGQRFGEGDQLAFAYRSKGFRFMSMVMVDAKGEVSWLYPAAPRQSIPIAAQGALQGAIELDGSTGQERILTFFSMKPLTPSHIKRQLDQVQAGHVKIDQIPSYVHLFTLQK